MSEERELVKKRGSFKGRLTGFVNYLDQLSDKTTDSCDVTELQLRIGKMETVYEQYDEVQLRLECIADDVKGQFVERSEFESLYYKTLSRAQTLLTSFNKDLKSVCSDKTVRSNTHKPVKLPTIQLPKFSGSYCNWLEFHDTFTSLIHLNNDIDEVNKFHYLRGSLEGSAAVVVKSVEFSANNYAVAWKLLCDRFNNKRLLVQNHVSALFNLDPINRESSTILKGLIDQLNKNLRALQSLGEPVMHWDTLLIYIITRKLDQKTYREWEEFKGRLDKHSTITYDRFMEFLRTRADLIETLELSRGQPQAVLGTRPKIKSMVSTQAPNTGDINVIKRVCPKCKGDHILTTCPQFLALSNDARHKLLPTYKVCFNCLKSGHFANNCRKPGCKLCKRKHNTLVHISESKGVTNSQNLNMDTSDNNMNYNSSSQSNDASASAAADTNDVTLSANITFGCGERKQSDVLLSTALIKLYDNNNRAHIVRAVLDSGSTSCFITDRLCSLLRLSTNQVDRSILGINNVSSRVGKTCRVHMTSLNDSFSSKLNCFVLPFITNSMPSQEINIYDLNLPTDVCLADPTFYKPSDVDLLIGADHFWDLLGSQRIKLGIGKPLLCETKLGWIVAGPISHNYVALLSNDIRCNFTKITEGDHYDEIRSDLSRFWQLEEVKVNHSSYLPEEKLCEDHFTKNTTRLSDGRFCVRIPLKQNPSVLGDSFNKATQCLYSLERRLKGKPDFREMYHEFMREYESLGHMTKLKTSDLCTNAYFIPHHGVLRECSTTTKLRVVFNASCPTSSGVSLNELQMVGPTVQDDILSILLRFRQHKYVLYADVEKMYRQVVVHPADRHLQRIVWRDSTDELVEVYDLNTVTYGTASAPFLATRCIKQIGIECSNDKIAEIIKHDIYVDDICTGSMDIYDVQFIRTEITKALGSAGMSLRKWKSNQHQLISESVDTPLDFKMEASEPDKLLGLSWYSDSDELAYSITFSESCSASSKRDILSMIARIFDPLGLLSPFVIIMKMLLQTMWLNKLSWDQPLTPELDRHWKGIIKSLPLLNTFRIPRIVVCDSYRELEIHIFTDASERAYGACVYIRTINEDGNYLVRLLMAKSRVAPLKVTTIPRLELCGAVVGARLYEKVHSSLRVNVSRSYCWTDSTIVLGWLQMLPSKLQPFVRNRVAEVLDKAGNCTWKHVPTDKNPADLISRGVDINVLQNSGLWWSGPEFLMQGMCSWPSQYQDVALDTLPETRSDISLSAVVSDNKNNLINLKRFSNYLRLLRSVAYVLRFIKLCRKHPVNKGFIAGNELTDALNVLICHSQRESFPEYTLLLNKNSLPKKSVLLKFNVFLDDNNIMRVGGRLGNSQFIYDKRHPILLQSTNEFTKLLFEYEHRRLMHAGPQLLLASIREKYWPVGGRNLAKACFHRCVTCRRMKGAVVTPLMGNLPRDRLLPGCPFESTGVDYAGPIMCASRQGRGCRLVKVYICIFICFTTKAIHLELVGDLTSNNYLLALYRFISRRGKPSNIYSDNGTSFVGAYNDLSKFLKTNAASLGENTANDGIKFHFIPAYSPHFGGIWEAGVKSTKFHLQRVLGNCNLTFEELYTTLTQIEAILNSRPLTPLSSDPEDDMPLTPGHFLIGRPLTSVPQPNLQDHCTNQLSRFHRIEQLRQHFWARWSKEYIAELQQRTKWRSCKDALELGSLVVIKEDNLPPLKWRLGRVVAVYPGSDGIVRVADIRTSVGVVRRAFNRICPLPVASNSG